MSISMSGATVTTDERDSLLSSEVDSSITSGGVSANEVGWTGPVSYDSNASGASLAGITAEFATNVTSKIDTYCEEVTAKVNDLSTVESNVAFKGTALEPALNNFIESIKAVANSYVNKLKAAEDEIINSVASAYATQDTDISGDLGSDGSSLEGTVVQ